MDTNISIRHAEPEDYEALYRIFSAPKAIRGTLQVPFPSRERWRQRLTESQQGLISLVASVDDQVVGSLTLRTFPSRPRRRHVGSIGMGVRDDWHNQGVGTALMEAAIDLADNWLNLTRLELTVFTDNAAAVHLYEKHGFEIEGRLDHYAFREGKYADCFAMARLRDTARGDAAAGVDDARR
jgi:putative acetyltransferase